MGTAGRGLAWVAVAVLATSLRALTTIDIGTYTVEQGQGVDVRVAVTGDTPLSDLNAWIAWDPAAVQIVPGSLWVSADRITNVWTPGRPLVPADFFSLEPTGDRLLFWLQLNSEPGGAGWQVSAVPAGSPTAAVFGFRLQGLARGPAALSFPYTPVATSTDVFHPEEPVVASAGSVLVYRPAGPVQIVPSGGAFSHAVEVAVSSEYATRIVYTLDGTTPGGESPELPLGTVLYLSGTDGQTIPLRVLALGEAGTSAMGAADFAFDMTAPAVTVTALATPLGRPVLSGTVGEPAAVVEVTVAGTTARATNGAGGTWSLDLTTVLGGDLPEGVYDVTAVATDPAGNSTTDATSGELTVDRTPPQGSFAVGAGNPAYVASDQVTLAVAVSGSAQMRFRNSGDEWGPWVSQANSLAWVLVAGDGSKTVFGEFRDAAGNSLAASDGVTLDGGLPVSDIATAGPYGPLSWPGEVTGSAADALSGVVRVEVQCVRADTGAYWAGSGWSLAEVWVTASGANSWSLELDGAALPAETTVTVFSRAVDRAGNLQSPPDQSGFVYDSTPPTGSFSIGAPGTVAVATRDVALQCSVTGAAQMRFREGTGGWTGWAPFAPARSWALEDADGLKTVQADFADAAGNGLSLSDSILLDRVAPTSTVSTAGGYGPSSWPGMVAGTCVDATSGTAGVAVAVTRLPAAKAGEAEYWDGSSWVAPEQWLAATVAGATWSVPLPEAAIEAGGNGRRYGVAARSHDLAGNVEATAVQSEFLFDARIPAGGFTVGAGNPLYVSNISVTLYCAVVAENPLEMRFRNDGESFPEAWIPYAATFSLTLPPGNGPKTVFAEFRDTVSRNTLATSDAATLDMDVPTCALATAGAFGPATWPGAVSGTAADVGPAGVERVEVTFLRGDGLYWNGTVWQAGEARLPCLPTAGAWSLAVPASALSDGGTYFVSARAVDRAGNLQTSPSTTVVSYDSSAPGGGFTIGAGDPLATATRDVTLVLAVTGGATEMAFRNVGGAWSSWEPMAGTRAWALVGTDGSKQVLGRFRDAVGNLLEASDAILFDSTPPTSAVTSAALYGPLTWPGSLAGTAADGLSGLARVEVRVQRGSDGQYWDGSGWAGAEGWLSASGTTAWQLPLASQHLADGVTYTVSSRAVDVAANVQGTPGSGSFAFDGRAPSATLSTPALVGPTTWPGGVAGTASDGLSGVAVVEVKLLRVLGAEVRHWDGAVWELGVEAPWLPAQGTQSWALPLALAELTDGASYSASCRAVDAVGNVQSPAVSGTFVFDGTIPGVPVVTGITTDTGLAGDWVTSDRTLLFSGQAEAGVAVEVRIGGTVAGRVVSGPDGAWVFDYTAYPLAAGTVSVEAAAVDGAGNRSDGSPSRPLVVDTVAPTLTCGLLPGAPVNGARPIVLTTDGLGSVGGSVDQAQWGAVQSGVSTLADVPGFGSLPEGAFTLYLRDSDLAGNVGRLPVGLVKDTLAPAVFGLSINPSRINAANRHALTFTLSGAEVGTTCSYSITSAARAAVNGSFAVVAASQVSPAISVIDVEDGLLTVTAVLSDAAGNSGPPATDEVAKDTVAPSGYTVAFEPAYVNASNQSAVWFILAGGEAGATCHYTVQSSGGGVGVTGSSVLASGTGPVGPMSLLGLADGTLTLAVYLTDPLGNPGGAAQGRVGKDVSAPAVPVVETLTRPVNQAAAAAVGITGRAEAGATVFCHLVSTGGGAVVDGSCLVGADGHFGVTGLDVTSLADGTLTLTVWSRDVAGNQSATGAGGTAQKDTVPPAEPVLASVSPAINAASVAQFAFSGTAEPGSMISYTLGPQAGGGAGLSGTLSVNAGGAFGLSGMNVAGLPDGVLELRLSAQDGVGNPSAEAHSGPIIKDTGAPEFELTAPRPGPVSGDEALVFSVSEPATVRASVNGEDWTVLETGVTTVQQLAGFGVLGEVLFTVSFSVQDAAGNTASRNHDFTKDTILPSGYAVTFAEDFVDSSATGDLAFGILNAEVGATFSFVIRDSASSRGRVAGGGTVVEADQIVTGVSIAGLAQGTLTLELALTDAAGNTGPSATATTALGTTLEVVLGDGWNAIGCTVAAVDSVDEILREAAGRADGALVQSALHGYTGGLPTALAGDVVPEFARAYMLFAGRAGTLRVRGVAGPGLGAPPAGWTYAAPGEDMLASDVPASWSLWSDALPGLGYRRLLGGVLLPSGVPLWVYVAP